MTPFVQATRLAAFAAARLAESRPPLPLNLTLSVTRACDSRCRTCGIWRLTGEHGAPQGELDLGEYERMFASIGRGAVWFLNISGGEPTLREDLAEIVRAAREHLAPGHVHLPTNGIDPDRICKTVQGLLAALEGSDTVLSVKPSLDGVGEMHDRIRGVAGNFESVMETMRRLVALRREHPGRMEVGAGTVISRFNERHTDEIVRLAESLDLDSIIHEIAENREEMGNETWSIMPDRRGYLRAVMPFASSLARAAGRSDAMTSLRAGLRLRMIHLTARWLRTGRRPLPCYAGITNAHVGPEGDLWACAVRARTLRMASLREHGMDFAAAWASEGAREARARARRGECACPLANQLYADILLDPVELARTLASIAALRIMK